MKLSTKHIRARAKEPSTWAAVAAVAATVALGTPPEAAATVVTAGGSWHDLLMVLIPAILGVVLPEGKDKAP